MVKKAPKTESPKDPKYSEKLEEGARKMFGRSYRFLNAEQKKAVNAETKFEPKLPEQSNNPPMGEQTQPTAQNLEAPKKKVVVEDDEEEAPKAVPLSVVIQYKCGNCKVITNGKPMAPAPRCRACNSEVVKTGEYRDDEFYPVGK